MLKYIMLKWEISEINDFTDNMLERRKDHDYIRTCGYVLEEERKLSSKFPKTYKEYERAKVRWFRAFDNTQEEWQRYTDEMEYKRIVMKQHQLDKMEKELRIIKEDVNIIKRRMEDKLGGI